MSAEGKKAPIFELADALLKSWWTVVAGICFGLTGAVLLLNYMPKVYETFTKIRIAPQSIPEDFVRSTVTDDMSRRLLEIEEAILSRSYMDKLIERNFAMPSDEESRDGLIRLIRSRVDVVQRRNTPLCALVYRDTDPQRAADVVNHLTKLYVEQNREFRTDQAQNTRETFESLAAEAKQELDAIEQQLNEFQTLHRHETEAFLDANLQLLETRRQDLDANQREQSSIRLRQEALQAKLEQGDWTVPVEGGTVRDPRVRKIQEARRELESLRVHYSESHPAVQKKKRELEDLLAEIAASGGEGEEQPVPMPVDPELAALESQIESLEREQAGLEAEEGTLRREIAKIERRIDKTPDIQARLSDMVEQQRVLKERYRDLKGKAERARGSEFLEETEQGQRLEVIEWAVVPFRPSYPKPMNIYGLAVLVGCLLFVGPLLLRSLLNPLVSSEAGLRLLVDVPVLVSIPRIPTLDNAGIIRRRFLKNMSFSLLFTAVFAAVFVVLG